jgi:hypothetical protein
VDSKSGVKNYRLRSFFTDQPFYFSKKLSFEEIFGDDGFLGLILNHL